MHRKSCVAHDDVSSAHLEHPIYPEPPPIPIWERIVNHNQEATLVLSVSIPCLFLALDEHEEDLSQDIGVGERTKEEFPCNCQDYHKEIIVFFFDMHSSRHFFLFQEIYLLFCTKKFSVIDV